MFLRPALCTLLLITTLGLPISYATTYDAADDFSLLNNPNGPWSYGFKDELGGTFFPYYNTLTTAEGLSLWYGETEYLFGGIPDIDPVIAHNGTGAPVGSGNLIWAPDQLSLHPGVITWPYDIYNDNPYSILRWTAPGAGTYLISASFTGLDGGGTTTDVHVLLNGVSLFDALVNGFGPDSEQAFLASLSLSGGDIIDFAVGPNGEYQRDTTALDATVAANTIPEPGSLLLLGTGLGLLGLAVRRKK